VTSLVQVPAQVQSLSVSFRSSGDYSKCRFSRVDAESDKFEASLRLQDAPRPTAIAAYLTGVAAIWAPKSTVGHRRITRDSRGLVQPGEVLLGTCSKDLLKRET
jgi:hypothetical protein